MAPAGRGEAPAISEASRAAPPPPPPPRSEAEVTALAKGLTRLAKRAADRCEPGPSSAHVCSPPPARPSSPAASPSDVAQLARRKSRAELVTDGWPAASRRPCLAMGGEAIFLQAALFIRDYYAFGLIWFRTIYFD